MQGLANCTRCGDVFVKGLRSICPACYKKEEEAFDIVYRFLREQQNREATILEIVEATGVEEELIIKFVKENRLRTSQFPKLAYTCEQCSAPITSGKMCTDCSSELMKQLEVHEQLEQKKNEQREKQQKANIYFSINKHKKK